MIKILKDEKMLSFNVEKESARIGDGNKIVFWIDNELQMLQRGRQEYIPVDSIDQFIVADMILSANLGETIIPLYTGSTENQELLNKAVRELNQYCNKK